MHVQVDSPPHVLEDEIGLRLAAPDDGWRRRPDMDPQATSGYRAAIVARARFIERSEEHTSELQSRLHLVCRLLLEKKKTQTLLNHFDRGFAKSSKRADIEHEREERGKRQLATAVHCVQ